MKVIVIGGGPAGMMAGISSAENGNEVIILEKMESLGRKLLITGKGRCNITSSLDMDEFIKNTPRNGMFLYSAFKHYTNKEIVNFLKSEGLDVKEERGNRIFPITDKSLDVLKCFTRRIKELNINVKYKNRVEEILIENNEVMGVRVNGKMIKADKIIFATGGKSYPLTGSTGDGYELIKKLGHSITKIKPSLVPLESYDLETCKNLQGLSLRNVNIKLKDIENKKLIYEDFGEMLFTHFGVSGPIVLSGSAHLIRYKNIDKLLKQNQIKLFIDVKPALSEEQLDLRIRRDFEELKNKEFKNSLFKLLPKKMIDYIVEKSNIEPNKKVNEITKEERKTLVKLLKNLKFTVKNTRTVEEAIITAGGINVKEINPSTMESKLVKDLYFAGEVIDVDAYTGGFNLQIAYSTGFVAGLLK